jgi:hypothetical protein
MIMPDAIEKVLIALYRPVSAIIAGGGAYWIISKIPEVMEIHPDIAIIIAILAGAIQFQGIEDMAE